MVAAGRKAMIVIGTENNNNEDVDTEAIYNELLLDEIIKEEIDSE